ncbi:hypothetical protein DFH08DRAFT_797077 [Mycena albidolilacea]|uniref:Uncharacterized protein n=1 Tax=Mycena albidolilacea TaxID=1033008 RepID=A0AAD7AQR8_9AGAR|nr:hypothetical protein DFH08DRAFT_797077 [Mycena albidolilacea]
MSAAPPSVHRMAKEEFTLLEQLDLLPVYDCDISLNVVSGLMASGTSSVAADFAVGENGGLVRAGDTEKSHAEGEAPPSAPLGHGQRKKIGTSRYQGPLREEHW